MESLFVDQAGNSMEFTIADGIDKSVEKELVNLIEEFGGTVVMGSSGGYMLVDQDSGCKDTSKRTKYSTEFIQDCIERQETLDITAYIVADKDISASESEDEIPESDLGDFEMDLSTQIRPSTQIESLEQRDDELRESNDSSKHSSVNQVVSDMGVRVKPEAQSSPFKRARIRDDDKTTKRARFGVGDGATMNGLDIRRRSMPSLRNIVSAVNAFVSGRDGDSMFDSEDGVESPSDREMITTELIVLDTATNKENNNLIRPTPKPKSRTDFVPLLADSFPKTNSLPSHVESLSDISSTTPLEEFLDVLEDQAVPDRIEADQHADLREETENAEPPAEKVEVDLEDQIPEDNLEHEEPIENIEVRDSQPPVHLGDVNEAEVVAREESCLALLDANCHDTNMPESYRNAQLRINNSIIAWMNQYAVTPSQILCVLHRTNYNFRVAETVLRIISKRTLMSLSARFPQDIPGAFTLEDDADIYSYDTLAIRRVYKKHGWLYVEQRKSYLLKLSRAML
ncbi:uncharacterized protein V1518DRAFT_409428 [Limtongia smithiae]|uniref:uncharacterized protein n=1 Tax=Limtongia smithiae TaxID=1125753 RepID=UPI0034CDFCE5